MVADLHLYAPICKDLQSINELGESEESKELSYTAVMGKIGLIYFKDLFDK